MSAGGLVSLNVTFLSPLTPTDFKRQSLVFSYLDVVVESLDGKSHDVQLYADTSAGTSHNLLALREVLMSSRMVCWRP